MSDEDIIRIANQAGWDVQNLDDGFGERLRRFAQALERQPLYTAPPNKEWVGLHGSEVPEPYKYDVMFNEGWWWAEDKLKEKNT